jgi:MFS family permease
MIVDLIGTVGTGAFVPIGFSIIGDSFSPKERGDKFGFMQVALLLGGGWGLILGAIFVPFGALGWRIVYIVISILSLSALYLYHRFGIDPERGRVETAFEDFKGAINYDYKITWQNVSQITRKKSLLGLLISIFFTGIATTTMGLWTIFYFTEFRFNGNHSLATVLYIGVMVSSLPGNIIGGRLGDKYFKEGKLRGRAIVSFVGIFVGVILQMIFFLMPISTPIDWIFFILVGILQAFLCGLETGNRFAIYSEVCAPELRSTVNSLHVMMTNLGGVIGNIVIASMVQANPALMPNAIALVLFIWLIGSTLWVVPYFSYPKEAKECDDLLAVRRREIESKST